MKRKKTKIYTKKGDSGKTKLFGNTEIEKDSIRVEAYGTIDELSAIITIIQTQNIESRIIKMLTQIQEFCFTASAEIATDNDKKHLLKHKISIDNVEYVESKIDEFDDLLPELNCFINSLNNVAASYVNFARTVCRRAERRLIALSKENEINPPILALFNRMSDLFFVLMRTIEENPQ